MGRATSVLSECEGAGWRGPWTLSRKDFGVVYLGDRAARNRAFPLTVEPAPPRVEVTEAVSQLANTTRIGMQSNTCRNSCPVDVLQQKATHRHHGLLGTNM
jgi:hypothetical protein